jgi:hypothetical protein
VKSFPVTRAGTALAAKPRGVAVLVLESHNGVNAEMLTMLTNYAQQRNRVAASKSRRVTKRDCATLLTNYKSVLILRFVSIVSILCFITRET